MTEAFLTRDKNQDEVYHKAVDEKLGCRAASVIENAVLRKRNAFLCISSDEACHSKLLLEETREIVLIAKSYAVATLLAKEAKKTQKLYEKALKDSTKRAFPVKCKRRKKDQ